MRTLCLSLGLTIAFAPLARGAENDCKKAFAVERKKIEQLPTRDRMKPALLALHRACPEALGALGYSAKKAAGLTPARRANVLATAGSMSLGGECTIDEGRKPAKTIAKKCPLPPALRANENALEKIDAGSYLFTIAVERALKAGKAYDENAEAILNTLLLAAALEGSAASKTP